MRLYRLTKPHRPDALDGTGAFGIGGRFSPAGMYAVYLSESESLARLESLSGVRKDKVRARLLHVIEVPEDETVTLEAAGFKLPADSRGVPWPPSTQILGGAFLEQRKALGMWVPSVHSKTERNLLVNPAHSKIAAVRVLETSTITFDARLS